MWIKLSKWSTWQNYANGVLGLEQFPLQLWKTDFPVKWAAGAFVLFIDSNPSFAALNLAEDGAQLSINSSNRPSDTSIMRLALARCVFFFPPFQKNSNVKLYLKPQCCCTLCIYLIPTAGVITLDIFPLWLIASIVYIMMHQSCTWRRFHLGFPAQLITAHGDSADGSARSSWTA